MGWLEKKVSFKGGWVGTYDPIEICLNIVYCHSQTSTSTLTTTSIED